MLLLFWFKETKWINLSEKDNLEKIKLEEHVGRWNEQSLYFKNKKKEMTSHGNSNWVIIVQDFTQLQVQNTFYQDLIICLYYLDVKSSDLLGKKVFSLRFTFIFNKKWLPFCFCNMEKVCRTRKVGSNSVLVYFLRWRTKTF